MSTVLVVGADRGIAHSISRQLHERGDTVVAACLGRNDELAAAGGIVVLMLHPGMVATDLTRDFPGNHDYITPDEAAAGLISDMDQLTPENSGRFQHSNGTFLPW